MTPLRVLGMDPNIVVALVVLVLGLLSAYQLWIYENEVSARLGCRHGETYRPCFACDESVRVQGDESGPPTQVPRWIAEAAHKVYAGQGHRQSLDRIQERGGFGRSELLWLLAGGEGGYGGGSL